MKVLLTGAGGFLGNAVRTQLLTAGYDLIGTSHGPAKGLVTVDLEDSTALLALLDELQPDAIVNCAARVDFGANILPGLFTINVLLPALISRWCRAHDAYLVQASTIVVHGTQVPEAGPNVPVQPNTDYGRSKLLAEMNIEQAGCQAMTLRFGGLFGRWGPEHLGLNRAVRGARDGKVPTLVGQGLAKRNYVFIHDAAALIAHCVQFRPTGLRWVGGGQVLSVREMLETICDVYLPGVRVATAAGPEATDQIIHHSPDLPAGRTFREALEHEKPL